MPTLSDLNCCIYCGIILNVGEYPHRVVCAECLDKYRKEINEERMEKERYQTRVDGKRVWTDKPEKSKCKTITKEQSSLRDKFAMVAMQGILASGNINFYDAQHVVEAAYRIADKAIELISARSPNIQNAYEQLKYAMERIEKGKGDEYSFFADLNHESLMFEVTVKAVTQVRNDGK